MRVDQNTGKAFITLRESGFEMEAELHQDVMSMTGVDLHDLKQHENIVVNANGWTYRFTMDDHVLVTREPQSTKEENVNQ